MKTKGSVRKEFTYLRSLLQDADKMMKVSNKWFDKERAEELANEIIASATVFAEWVDEQEEI